MSKEKQDSWVVYSDGRQTPLMSLNEARALAKVFDGKVHRYPPQNFIERVLRWVGL